MIPKFTYFGFYKSTSRPFAFWGTPGWFTVPAGRNWYQVTDAGQQIWASPNPITFTNGKPTGKGPIYACELNIDGTLVYQNKLSQRELNIDSPPHDRLSPFN